MKRERHKTIADRYKVIEILGEGGMGVVYKVVDKILDRPFAVKMLHSGVTDSEIVRFQNEARTTGILQHDRIVRAYNFGVADSGEPYLVVELLAGMTLDEHLKKAGRLSLEASLNIAMQTCEGLRYAHGKGILHRDIKPSNLFLVGGEIDVKILDFGLAKTQDRGQSITQTGHAIGSPFYMSPEQTRGLEIDQRSDIYSLGCVIFKCVTGEEPVQGINPVETIRRKLSESAPLLSEVAPGSDVPEALDSIVAKCLERDPEDRFRDTDELIEALSAVSLDRPGEPSTATGDKVDSSTGLQVQLPAVAVFTLSFLVLAAVAFIFTSRESGEVEQPVGNMAALARDKAGSPAMYVREDIDNQIYICGGLEDPYLNKDWMLEFQSFMVANPRIRSFVASQAVTTIPALRELFKVRGLSRIELQQVRVEGAGDEGILPSLDGVDDLERLDLMSFRLSDADLSEIAKLKGLRRLGLAHSYGFSATALGAAVRKLTALEYLEIGSKKGFTPEFVLEATRHGSLRCICFADMADVLEQLDSEKMLPRIPRIGIEGGRLTATQVGKLSLFRPTTIRFSRVSHFNSDVIDALGTIKTLRQLVIFDMDPPVTRVSEEDWIRLAGNKELDEIVVDGLRNLSGRSTSGGFNPPGRANIPSERLCKRMMQIHPGLRLLVR